MIQHGGLLMLPILLSSIIALAIVAERFWSLQAKKVTPSTLVAQVWQWHNNKTLTDEHIVALSTNSPLGKILATGLMNRHQPREIMKESIEEAGHQVIHELERYLKTL